VHIEDGAQGRAEAERHLTEAREGLAEARRDLAEEQAAPAPTDGRPRDLGVRLANQAVTLAEAEVARREAALRRIDEAIARRQNAAQQNAAQQPAAGATPQTATQTASASNAGPSPASASPPAAATQGEIDDVGTNVREDETWQDALRRKAMEPGFHASDNPRINERIRQNFLHPELTLYKMQEAASKYSFLLAPLSLPFIALLFLWKRGVNLYDHVVYALYALSFAAILFIAVIVTAQSHWTSWLTPWLVVVGLPVHTFFHLKGAYALGWFSALWRTFFMLTFACIIMLIFLMLVVVLGLVA